MTQLNLSSSDNWKARIENEAKLCTNAEYDASFENMQKVPSERQKYGTAEITIIITTELLFSFEGWCVMNQISAGQLENVYLTIQQTFILHK
jgi:hypothetical protein